MHTCAAIGGPERWEEGWGGWRGRDGDRVHVPIPAATMDSAEVGWGGREGWRAAAGRGLADMTGR